MRLLLDTHALVWWMLDDARLSPAARGSIEDVRNDACWSAASTWELAIKVSLRRIEFRGGLRRVLTETLRAQSISILPVQHAHALRVEELPLHHRDPFDRMLAAQALEEDLVLVTRDPVFAAYEVETLW